MGKAGPDLTWAEAFRGDSDESVLDLLTATPFRTPALLGVLECTTIHGLAFIVVGLAVRSAGPSWQLTQTIPENRSGRSDHSLRPASRGGRSADADVLQRAQFRIRSDSSRILSSRSTVVVSATGEGR